MKERYVTITGTNYYYGMKPFSVGKKLRCVKERDNCFDSEAIKVVMKEIGTVGYIANSPHTAATGTMSAGRIYDQVPNKFMVQVMFITCSKVICRVLDGDTGKQKKRKDEKQYGCEGDLPYEGKVDASEARWKVVKEHLKDLE